jgi:hypothetical protein
MSFPFGNLVLNFLLGISEIFLCSISAPQVNIVLLDAPQLLMLFVGTLTYLEPSLFLLIIIYNGFFNYQIINDIQDECMYLSIHVFLTAWCY